MFNHLSIYTRENIFISSEVRDTKTREPKLIACALQSRFVDPVGGSKYLDNKLCAAVDTDVVIETILKEYYTVLDACSDSSCP